MPFERASAAREFANADTSRRWGGVAVAVGLGYALVGILFAMPATHALVWRRAAWGVSAIGYAAHLAYERYGLRSPTLPAARHVAVAVAIGAFGLAVGANVHSFLVASPSPRSPLLVLSLVLWPAITVPPAFVVALAASTLLPRRPRI